MLDQKFSPLKLLADLLRQVGVAFLYILFGKCVHTYFSSSNTMGLVWPGSGLALAILILGGKRYLVGIAAGALIFNTMISNSLWIIFGVTLANIVEALCGYLLLNRNKKFSSSLNGLIDYINLVFIGGAIPSISGAILGGLSLLFSGLVHSSELPKILLNWWMRDTLMINIVTPFIIVWSKIEIEKKIKPTELVKDIFLFLITIFIGQIVFLGWFSESLSKTPKGYWMFIFIVSIAIRSGVRGTTLIIPLIGIQALYGAINGKGFFSNEIESVNFYSYWGYMLIISLVGMVLSTYVNQIQNMLKGLKLKDSALQAAANGIIITDRDGMIEWANNAYTRLTGYSTSEIFKRNPRDLIKSGKHDEAFYKNLWDTILANKVWEGEIINRRKDGSLYNEEMTITPLNNDQGEITHFIAVKQDISDRKQMEIERRANEEQLRAFYDLDLVGLAITSDTKLWLRTNNTLCKMLEYSEEELKKMTWAELTHPDDLNTDEAEFNRLLANEINGYTMEKRFITRSGREIFAKVVVRCVRKNNGSVDYITVMIEDITKRKLTETEARIAATVFESQVGMMITDANEIILKVNKAFTQITGYNQSEVIGKTPRILSSGIHDKIFFTEMWKSVHEKGAWQGEIWNRRKKGEIFPESLTITAVKDSSDNKIMHYVATITDITERKKTEEHINRLAFYDPLTQLPNRRLLNERMKYGIESCRRKKVKMAVLMLDLDKFKPVNDKFGHATGDELLQQVTRRIKSRLRENDMVSRFGGDEFVILIEEVQQLTAIMHIAEDIIRIISLPFELNPNLEVQIGVSIGISICPEDGQTTDILLKKADTAMYKAKEEGRGCFAFY